MTDGSRYLMAMQLPSRQPEPRPVNSLLLAAVLALGAFCALVQTASAAPAFYDGNSADGTVAVFSSKDQMVPGDTDQELDVYVRAFDGGLGEYLTREVSIGPKGGNDAQPAIFDGMSSDGNEIFFSTNEPIVAGDADHSEDIYARILSENRTVLVSQGSAACAGQGCGSGAFGASFLPGGVAPDGGIVFFGSKESLDGADKDGAFDIYVRDLLAETTTLVSAPDPGCGTCSSEGLDPQFRGTDDAGDRAFFTTSEKLASGDSDSGEEDIYARDLGAGSTSLVSVAGTCPSGLPVGESCEPSYGGASADGSHVFFESRERIGGGDTDSSQDLYDWAGGAPSLASTGPAGGNGAPNVTFAGSSPDGATVYFETSEPLVSEDADSSQDVYQRSAGATALVSAGAEGRGNLAYPASFEFSSASAAIFTTDEQLTAGDTDSSQDVYERSGGVTTLLSTGPQAGGEYAANFASASADASRVFFSTAEQLVPADQDSSPDIYLRDGVETILVSGGQIGGNGAFAAGLRGIAVDGSRVFFTTQERLAVDDDFSAEQDVYAWTAAGTLLVSVENSPDLVIGPPPPTLERTTPASPNQSTTPAIVGQAAAESLVKIYKSSDCSGEPVAQGTAAQLASPGLTVSAPLALGSTTSFRATAEAEGVVSACSSAISYKQEDPAPPPEEEGTGGTPEGGGTSTGGTTGTTGGKTGKTPGGNKNGIEYVVPQLKITFGPAFKTRLRRPVFRFADLSGQPGTSYFCRVDKKRWKGCTSPTKLKKQRFGRHVFAVKAVNAVGTPSARPLKRAFKVVHR
ncbi:MAG TPA: hypothetical protein VEP91_04780 [Solirubrobacterales bacterium]|nr:hypothetical protein [Solirubrobacterales bacterium]